MTNLCIPFVVLSFLFSGSATVWAADSERIHFSCRNVDSASVPTQIKGQVTGPLSEDWSNPKSATANVQVQVGPSPLGVSTNEQVAMTGILLSVRQYRGDGENWVYVPMRTFLQGRLANGAEINAGFYFGLGRESLITIQSSGVSLTLNLLCNFAELSAPAPVTPNPHCHEECRWTGGGHDGPRWVCGKTCDGDRGFGRR